MPVCLNFNYRFDDKQGKVDAKIRYFAYHPIDHIIGELLYNAIQQKVTENNKSLILAFLA